MIGLDIGLRHDNTVATVMHRGDGWDLQGPETLGEVELIDRFLAGQRGDVWVRQEPSQGAVFVLDEMRVWKPSRLRQVNLAEVEEAVAALSSRYGDATVVFDRWQAEYLAERLRSRGLRMKEFAFTAQSVGKLGLALFDAVRQRRLDLYRDDDLLRELAGVQLVENAPGSYRLDHPRGRHDDRAVAMALCIHELLARPPAPPAQSYVDDRLAGRR